VVLTRTVDPGNAVAASLQAVTLFTWPKTWRSCACEVYVDEADVGAVKVGQKASFTVSAYPSRRFPATITRVAFGSTITDNVVTYLAWLDVDNSDLSLRPGMTATGHHRRHRAQRRAAGAQHGAALHAHRGGGCGPGRQRQHPVQTHAAHAPPPRKAQGRRQRQRPPRQIWVLQDGQPWPCR
jgi:HlyD family secretion protein